MNSRSKGQSDVRISTLFRETILAYLTSSQDNDDNSLILALFPQADRPKASLTRKYLETNLHTAGDIFEILFLSLCRRIRSTAADRCVAHEV